MLTRYKGPEESPGFLLWKVSTEWRRKIEKALLSHGLTHPQYVLLACLGWLSRNGQAVSQVELAKFSNSDITQTSQVLRTLEQKGYIERYQQEGNARSKFPRLTAAGKKLVKQTVAVVEEADEQFFERIKKERKEYLAILQKLVV